MRTARITLFVLLALTFAVSGYSQQDRKSPHETVTAKVGEANITVVYGRPYKKGREIFGGLEPLGKVWRTGADEATTIETDSDLMVGAMHVPAGKYGLFTLPDKSGWKLIINKTADQWGAFDYDDGQDLGRVDMEVSQGPVVEQLTIEIKPTGGDNGTLTISWDKTIASIDIMAH